MSDTTWFPYGSTHSLAGFRPVVPVRFRHQDGRMAQPTPILIDSGADSTAFPVGMAELLGVSLQHVPISTNRFGRQQSPDVPVAAEIAGIEVTLKPRFLIDKPLFVLGRWDFFAHFKVKFDELNLRVGLEPYPAEQRGQHPHPFPAAILD